MKKKQNRTAVMQWIVPITVLLLIVIVLLINFSYSAKEDAKEIVEQSLLNTADQYAARVHTELEAMTKAGEPISATVVQYWNRYRDDQFIIQMLENLKQYTSAYMVILSDLEGKAVTDTGEKEDISGETFFAGASLTGQKYIYAKEGVRDRAAIISGMPVRSKEKTVGYLFMFYPEERFRNLIRKVEFDNLGFYAIVTEDGTIIEGVGTPTKFLEGDNILDTLSKSNIYEGNFEKTKLRFSKLSSGIVGAEYQGERRTIVYAPFEINTWHMLIGVNQSYVDELKIKESAATHSMIWKLVAALGIFIGLVMVINIVSKIHSDERGRILENKADTDLLTELNNKLATERKIKEYMEECRKKPELSKALMFVFDVDNFKKINDTMGHAFGDEVLRNIGLELKSEFRVSDILGRTGGDEFMVFLKDVKDNQVVTREVERMERLFKDFKAGEYVKYSVTASIGCALFPQDADNFEDLYKAADKALYKAKKRGKNQIAMYTEADASIDLEEEKRKSRT
ncbi:MAG: GGDEF domain-containing protein [Clostridiales bacterium]|nr:GGDEF domain-containing protein [Clostridiales bacterium]